MPTEKLWVRWLTQDPDAIERIRQRFNIPRYTTIGKMSPAEIASSDMPILEATAKRGFIAIIHEKWSKNGALYSFISRK